MRIVPMLLGVFIVAIIWEVYEVLIGIPIEDDYWFDTIVDLIMGLCGGWIGHMVGKRMNELQG